MGSGLSIEAQTHMQIDIRIPTHAYIDRYMHNDKGNAKIDIHDACIHMHGRHLPHTFIDACTPCMHAYICAIRTMHTHSYMHVRACIYAYA
jgi:hypothetical protein